jgi:MFS family permease
MRSSYAGIICALFLAEMAATFETSMLYAALPTLIRDFGDPVTAGWLVTIHMLVGSAAAILAGRLGDIKGRRTMMMVLLAISGVGSVISAVTTDFAIVFAGRALQGLSVAVLPLSIGVLRESLPEDRVPVAIGLMTTAQGMGIAVGLVLGGVIIDHLNWHWLFALSAVLLAVSWVAVRQLIPARPGIPPKAPIDWFEGVLPVPGIVAVLLGVSLSKEAGWFAPQVWGLVAVGLVIVAIWVRRSLRAAEPFIDLRILGIRNVALANAINVLLAFGTMQLVFVFSTYTQAPGWTMAGLGMSATVAGLAKLPSNFLSFFAGPLSGLLTQKFGNRLPVVAGAMLAGFGWVIAMGLPTSLTGVIVLLCVISFGTTILNAAIPNVIVGAVPDERTSEAVGTMSVLRGLASAIGVQFVAVLLASATVTAPEGGAVFPSAAGYRLTMGWISALTFAGAVIALLLRVRQQGAMRTVTT